MNYTLNYITKLSKTIKQSITQNKLLKIIIYLISFIVISILVLMTSSFAINWLVNTPNPFGLGFINKSNKDTWINFFGAVIGGITTLAGVWLTIKDNDNKRREDLAIQYKPLFGIENIRLENDGKNDMLTLTFCIKNIGRGEAYGFKIECNKDVINSEDEDINNCFKKNIILPNDETYTSFNIQICDSDFCKKVIVTDNDMLDILSYNIIITVTYSNMLNKTYKQFVHIPASYNKTEDKCRINYSEILYEHFEE